jgi:uncharacterized protein (TIGR00725 family)
LIGDSRIRSKEQYKICYEIGVELARHNSILICGGRGGIMEAACKGIYDEGGISVGILPQNSDDPDINPYLSIKIPTNLSWARNSIIPLASDALIACGGEFGTLSEISYSWLYKKIIVFIVGIGGWSQRIGKNPDSFGIPADIPFYTASSGCEAVNIILNNI